jgi:chromosome segregation ATPase
VKTQNLKALDPLPDIKPMRLKGNLKPLPSIKASEGDSAADMEAARLAEELYEKKRQTEEVLKKSADQLAEQRKREEDLRKTLNGIDPNEAEKRAEHMRRQRELLLAKKKAERDQKVKDEERRAEAKGGSGMEASNVDSKAIAAMAETASNNNNNNNNSANDEIAEMRRATMRMALARRLKMDITQSEEAKFNAAQESQFSELDKKLQQVEQMREDNRKKEYLLTKQLERQKEQIARNVELSAALLKNSNT